MFNLHISLIISFVVQLKTGCVALVLCLNIGVDPPDVIKISPCARMECWIGDLRLLPLFPYSPYAISLDALYSNVAKSCFLCFGCHNNNNNNN